MKPRIKKQTYYSVLLMRDDGDVRSFRMKNTTLRFLVSLFLVFLVMGAGGIGVGIHYWKRFSEFMPEFREKDRALAETNNEVQDLRNFKAVVMAQSNCTIPMTMNTEVGAGIPGGTSVGAASNATVSGTVTERLSRTAARISSSSLLPISLPCPSNAFFMALKIFSC